MTAPAVFPGAFDGASVARHGSPHVKICGLTREEDVRVACECGASAVGFVLWPASPRAVEPSRAVELARAVSRGVLRVGVFVNALPDVVRRVTAAVPLDVVQLHGEEPIEWAGTFTRPIVKAVRTVRIDEEPWATIPPGAVTLLVDALDPERRGGTGRLADWTVARALAARRPIVLAGGLSADNVARAIAAVRPYAVDVSSGVESAPGIKDRDKVRALFEAVREQTARVEGGR